MRSYTLNAAHNLVRSVVLVLVIILASCDEPFPVYQEPEDVLQGELIFESADTVEAVWESFTSQWYFNDVMTFRVEITNVHDDLLEGKARVDGMILVLAFSDIPRATRAPLNTGNLVKPPVFQGNIAIGPGRQAVFSTFWLPVALDGNAVWEGLPFTAVGAEKIYGPISFLGVAGAQLFERVQPIQFGEIKFELCFRVKGK